MDTRQRVAPLIAIVGPTGSGKSSLAMRLAACFNGEIIAADSRTVYTGMDVGTAKPTRVERMHIRHHGLDVVAPDDRFNVFNFKQLAIAAIDDVTARDGSPLLVGGTGLYVDAVLFDFAFRPASDLQVRAELETLTVLELQQRVLAAGLNLPENSSNPRHLMRLLESGALVLQQKRLRPHTLVIGLQVPTQELTERLQLRAEEMLGDGLIDEAKQLVAQYGVDNEALRAPAYKAVISYLSRETARDSVRDTIVANDLKLAKRQRTWFRRNPCIHWLSNGDVYAESVELITAFLNK
ncbi:MAG: tRNA (adenosine(37)-N6)-dimethylallyltransferase [Candidatus Micrarchaeaceae archaeon]